MLESALQDAGSSGSDPNSPLPGSLVVGVMLWYHSSWVTQVLRESVSVSLRGAGKMNSTCTYLTLAQLTSWHDSSISSVLFVCSGCGDTVCAIVDLLEGSWQNELYVYIPDPRTINQLTRFQHKQCVICLLWMRWYSVCYCRPGRSGMCCNTRCRSGLCSIFLA